MAFLSSCADSSQRFAEAEHSAFGKYVYALDTLRMEQCLTHLLDADSSRWESDKTVRQRYASVQHFEEKPLWFARSGVSWQADSLLDFLRREVTRHALDSSAFFVPQIAADLAIVHQLNFDSLDVSINEVLPRLDYLLSKAYVRYTTGQRYGFVRPDQILNHMDFKDSVSGYACLFDYEVQAPDYQRALQKLSAPDRMDYLYTSQPSDDVYKLLQARYDTVFGRDARRQLAVNMERCRWQMKRPTPTERMVLVNIPAQQLWAVCPDSVLNMRICCGSVVTKTPLLCSEISHMQVNPDWIIPQSIVKAEVAAHGGDSAYFARHNYYIVERSSGDTLNPVYVSGDRMRSGSLRVGQRGGAGNSLGRIVFRFANNFSVYLHDTNNHGAFKREQRTLSHGCVRVQRPFSLACFLMPEADDWKLDRLRISMDMEPETDRGLDYLDEHQDDPKPFRLLTYQEVSPRVPVYIVYYTAYPNPETGRVEIWPDLYGYDKVISRAMDSFLP